MGSRSVDKPLTTGLKLSAKNSNHTPLGRTLAFKERLNSSSKIYSSEGGSCVLPVRHSSTPANAAADATASFNPPRWSTSPISLASAPLPIPRRFPHAGIAHLGLSPPIDEIFISTVRERLHDAGHFGAQARFASLARQRRRTHAIYRHADVVDMPSIVGTPRAPILPVIVVAVPRFHRLQRNQQPPGSRYTTHRDNQRNFCRRTSANLRRITSEAKTPPESSPAAPRQRSHSKRCQCSPR